MSAERRLRIAPLVGAVLGAMGVVAALTAVLILFSTPETSLPEANAWPAEVKTLLWGGAAAIALAVLANGAGLFRYLAGAKGKVFVNVAIMVALSFGLLVAVNWIGSRRYARADWTRAQLYGLSEQTEKILDGLREPVKVVVFFPKQNRQYGRIQDLLDRYRHRNPDKVELEFVNPDFERSRAEVRARDLGVTNLDSAVVLCGERQHVVTEQDLVEYEQGRGMFGGGRVKAFLGEQAFTSALLSVTQEKRSKVYFLTGHGERQLKSADPGTGYSRVDDLLRAQNMDTEEVSLAEGKEVPEDADVVVIAGPRREFLEPEVEALHRYLDRGGSMMVLSDPPLQRASDQKDAPWVYKRTGVETLLARWNVDFQDRVITDPKISLLFQTPFDFVATDFSFHDMTSSMQDAKVFYSIARPVDVKPDRQDVFAMPIVRTSDQSWGIVDIDRFQRKSAAAEQIDTKGPFTVALAIGPRPAMPGGPDMPGREPPPVHPARLIVVGDSDFALNPRFGTLDNRDFFLACIHWLARREELIAIPPREPEDFRLELTQGEATAYQLFALEGLPLVVVMAGFAVWWFRRQ